MISSYCSNCFIDLRILSRSDDRYHFNASNQRERSELRWCCNI